MRAVRDANKIFLTHCIIWPYWNSGLAPLSTHDRCVPFDASGRRPTIASYNGSKRNGQRDVG
jgi:hypothetical protein